MPVSTVTTAKAGTRAFVGRQPIFSPNLEVFGYELLYRSGEQNVATFDDGDYATANVITSVLTDIGLDVLTESKYAFINLTRAHLLNADLSCLPPDRIVLELLEDIEPDEAVYSAMQRLKEEGYTLALDDFVYHPKLETLVGLADIVKIDFLQTPAEQLADHIAKLRSLGVRTLLAEKVETHDDFELCKELGCDLFQGYFFCKPQILKRRRLQSNVGPVLRLVSELQDPDLSTAAVVDLVRADASLSYKILRFVNSAHSGTRSKIESLEHAITMLGRGRLQSLASMILLSSMNEGKPEELLRTAMMRAKLSELLAKRDGKEDAERFFTLGLLSAMDAMLDLPMEDVVKQLSLSNDMNEALLHRSGPLADVLTRASCLEANGEPTDDQEDLMAEYVEALKWAAQCTQAV